jgi:hypothetical protein
MIDRFNEKYELAASGCWLWTSTVSGGYGYFWLNGCQKLAHRVSWEIESGQPVPLGQCILHECDTPLCVNPKHLFLGTDADNVADKTAKQRQARGATQGLAKLTDDSAREIFLAVGSQKEIARRYYIHQSQVSNIKRRVTWRHATSELFA